MSIRKSYFLFFPLKTHFISGFSQWFCQLRVSHIFHKPLMFDYFFLFADPLKTINLSPSEPQIEKRKTVEAFIISCDLDSLGEPAGSISWKFKSQTIKKSTSAKSLTLNIDPLLSNHTGNYTCVGENSLVSCLLYTSDAADD